MAWTADGPSINQTLRVVNGVWIGHDLRVIRVNKERQKVTVALNFFLRMLEVELDWQDVVSK